MKLTQVGGLFVLLSAMGCFGQAGQMTLQPKTVAAGGRGDDHDAFIAQDGSHAGSGNGLGEIARYFGGYNRRYLVQFDDLNLWIGGPEAVTSAVLTLQFYYAPSNTNPAPPPSLNVHRITEPWVNGATWTSRGGSLGAWIGGAGGTFDPAPAVTQSFSSAPANYSFMNWDVTPLVSNWVAGATAHNGFLLKWSDGTNFGREWMFGGPGQGDGTAAPKLTIATVRTSAVPFQVTGPSVNVRTRGAWGDGVHNDTAAFRAAAATLQQAGGGTLVIPSGIYLVGEQLHVAGQYPYWQAQPIFSVANVTNFIIEGNGATLRVPNGLRFGAFDKDTGQPISPALPFYEANSAASVGTLIDIAGSQNVLIRDLRLDGNCPNLILGGQWGDTGRQLAGTGLRLYNNRHVWVENVHTHHHALDGLIIGWDGLLATDPPTPHQLFNVRSEFNARQGLSWVGGRGLTAMHCQFNHTGRAGFVSAPGAGLDIEGETAVCRDGYFEDCEFVNNAGCGVVADSGDGGDTRFVGCTMWGTSAYSIWVTKPGLRFENCNIRGTAVHGFGSADPALATSYLDCDFEDIAYGTNGVYRSGAGLIENSLANGENVTYDGCTFVAHQTRAVWLDSPGQTYFRNCTVVHRQNRDQYDFQSLFRGVVMQNVVFQEDFPPESAGKQWYLEIGNVNVGAGVHVDGPKCKWYNWSWGWTGDIAPGTW